MRTDGSEVDENDHPANRQPVAEDGEGPRIPRIGDEHQSADRAALVLRPPGKERPLAAVGAALAQAAPQRHGDQFRTRHRQRTPFVGSAIPTRYYRQPMRHRAGLTIALLLAGACPELDRGGLFAGPALAQSAQTRVPGTFRSNVTMVPLDVRVLDERGRPITDLEADDFTVLEDGVAQVIRQFSRLQLQAAPVSVGRGPTFRTAAETDGAPQNHRVFLIVLGRGRLQGPSRGLDALIAFIERRLLPQDQVAVIAYNRATDFTTDRQPILEVLTRFKAGNTRIESKLEHWYSGPPGNSEDQLPGHVQPLIDDLLAGPHATRFRQIPPGRIADARRLADGFEREAEKAESAGIQAFDSYVSSALATRQDLGSIYTGIEYLRFIDGEKRLIYVRYRWPLPAQCGGRSVAGRGGQRRAGGDRHHSDRRALRRSAGAAITVRTVLAAYVGHQRHPQRVRAHRRTRVRVSVRGRGTGGDRSVRPERVTCSATSPRTWPRTAPSAASR